MASRVRESDAGVVALGLIALTIWIALILVRLAFFMVVAAAAIELVNPAIPNWVVYAGAGALSYVSLGVRKQ